MRYQCGYTSRECKFSKRAYPLRVFFFFRKHVSLVTKAYISFGQHQKHELRSVQTQSLFPFKVIGCQSTGARHLLQSILSTLCLLKTSDLVRVRILSADQKKRELKGRDWNIVEFKCPQGELKNESVYWCYPPPPPPYLQTDGIKRVWRHNNQVNSLRSKRSSIFGAIILRRGQEEKKTLVLGERAVRVTPIFGRPTSKNRIEHNLFVLERWNACVGGEVKYIFLMFASRRSAGYTCLCNRKPGKEICSDLNANRNPSPKRI